MLVLIEPCASIIMITSLVNLDPFIIFHFCFKVRNTLLRQGSLAGCRVNRIETNQTTPRGAI